jgi:hypothetical protein
MSGAGRLTGPLHRPTGRLPGAFACGGFVFLHAEGLVLFVAHLDGALESGLGGIVLAVEHGRLGVEQELGDVTGGGARRRGRAVRGGGGLAGNFVGGWSYPSVRLGDFDQDYELRGTVALGGLAALPPAEAMYMRATGPLPGGLYDGLKAWCLHFPADAHLPVNSFWSLSLYEATPEGQFYFTDNPLNRYAIGDRTAGLTHNEDGSLDIWIGNVSPGLERETNWLPAPASTFTLVMRAYIPKASVLNDTWVYPKISQG